MKQEGYYRHYNWCINVYDVGQGGHIYKAGATGSCTIKRLAGLMECQEPTPCHTQSYDII